MLKIRLFRSPGNDLELPRYETSGSAGCDLRAFLKEPLTLSPGVRLPIPTGLSIAIPEGYEGQIRPRSGLAAKNGVTVLNSPGTIDSDYRGEIKVLLVNLGDQAFTIRNGDRIAQLVVAPCLQVSWEETANLSETERGSGGFGSTGVVS